MTKMGTFDERFYYAPYTLDEYYVKHGENSYQDFAQEIVEYVMALKTRPTAVFIRGSHFAVNACELFRKAGLKVPGDISVVGEFSPINKGEVSGILYDYSLRAAKAAEIMMSLMKKPDTPLVQKLLKQKWYPGKSIGPVRK